MVGSGEMPDMRTEHRRLPLLPLPNFQALQTSKLRRALRARIVYISPNKY